MTEPKTQLDKFKELVGREQPVLARAGAGTPAVTCAAPLASALRDGERGCEP